MGRMLCVLMQQPHVTSRPLSPTWTCVLCDLLQQPQVPEPAAVRRIAAMLCVPLQQPQVPEPAVVGRIAAVHREAATVRQCCRLRSRQGSNGSGALHIHSMKAVRTPAGGPPAAQCSTAQVRALSSGVQWPCAKLSFL